ncbi:IPT/TIG domain-containing protein [Streptomyces platensis]|uniref:IPT/TIG domain-containing protein n=1 Tax=Streptomyces platensis TaxID=58346 RepID=UPI003CD081F5
MTAGGASKSWYYTYAGAPTVTALSPTFGAPSGGMAFTLTGTNLTRASVTFNGVPGTSIVVNGAGTSLTGTAPHRRAPAPSRSPRRAATRPSPAASPTPSSAPTSPTPAPAASPSSTRGLSRSRT